MYGIENLFLFKSLPDDDTKKIVASLLSNRKSYDAGEEIYCHTCFSKALGIVISGAAEAVEGTLLKQTFKEGGVFGAGALFGSGESYISCIVAKSKCTVQFISEEELLKIFESYPVTAANYIAFLSDKIRFLNMKINLMSKKGAAAKLFSYLMENVDDNNTVSAVNMSKLAKLTSLGRTSLYRAVSELTEAGLIEKSGSSFVIKQ